MRRLPEHRPQEKRAYSQGKTRGLEPKGLLEEGPGAKPGELRKNSRVEEGASLGGQTPASRREALRQKA